MAHRKRQYGSGSLCKERGGWAIRWREWEIAPDGTVKKRKCYEALGNISRREATEILRGKVAAGDSMRSRFGDLALCEVTTVVIRTYVTHLIQVGCAPKSIRSHP